MAVNFAIDEALAARLFSSKRRKDALGNASWMLDVILAPSFSEEAIDTLGKREQRKLFSNAALSRPQIRKGGLVTRPVRGGWLRQSPPDYILDLTGCETEGGRFSDDELESLIIAWAVAFSSNHGGNEVALVREGVLIGVGGGPSSIEAAQVAVMRARACGHDVAAATFGADAFFPFTDAAAVVCDAGVVRGCIPSGGKNEDQVRSHFRAHGVKMAYLPAKYRGFCRH